MYEKITRVILALESTNEKHAEKIVKTRCVSKTREIVFYVLSNKIFSYQRQDEHMSPNQELLIDPEMTLIWYSGVRVKLRLCAHISLMANEPKNARNGFQIQAGSGLTSNLNHSCQLFSFKYFSNLKDSGCVFWFLIGVNLLSSVLSSSAVLNYSVASTEILRQNSKFITTVERRKVEKVKSLQMQNTINEECAEKNVKARCVSKTCEIVFCKLLFLNLFNILIFFIMHLFASTGLRF